ncbi:lysophospholipid acyltransferase family protein [Collinsella sp. An2]|uniref:lysophospholipid acyltransferase family protein n=1 Tax=Collinsella sp. An2 TaxID=1965585 RepID=UPI000B391B0E|nr:lysophospholipid acyltransferase family protein [Collinsella sp. An2]OUP08216.1 1-acyl-sn-glycerol-3-phosphate acyltransferase [Collinsella sp. An2]
MIKLFQTEDHYYDQGMRENALPIRILYYVVIAVLYIFSKVMWRWKVDNTEKLVPKGKTGSVIISNHTSMAEVVVTVTHIVRQGRRVRPIMKSEFNKNPIVRWFFARVGGIPVERDTADMKSLRRAQHALQRGEDVLIYPEGTRIRTDDQKVEVHGGFALIASMAKADIVPMAVCGFRDITRDGHHLMRPVKTWLRVGEPVHLDDAPRDLKRKERLQWVEDEAIRRMYAIRDELRVEHPGRR